MTIKYRFSRSLRISAFTSMAFFLLVAFLGASGASAQFRIDEEIESVPGQSAREQRPVSIVIEEGASAPEILIGHSADSKRRGSAEKAIADSPLELGKNEDGSGVVFTIVNGGGKFAATGSSFQSRQITGGVLRLPAIESGKADDEGVIRVLVDGRQIVDDIRIATVPAGGINSLRQYISEDDPALIAMGEDYAVVDESKWEDIPLDAVTEEITAEGMRVAAPSLGLCIRTPFGPGKVKYNGFSPWAAGKRYSYKPENSNTLRKGSGSSDDVDAVYRYIWGCNSAYKVPNSCTMTINSNGSWSACCNAAMMALGHKVKWVNPTSHGFPRCPISPF